MVFKDRLLSMRSLDGVIARGRSWETSLKGRQDAFSSMHCTSNTGGGDFPLRLAREGDWVRIAAVNGGRKIHERLAGFGMRIGSEVQVLHNVMNGKILLGHQGARLYLGGGMAHKIRVVDIRGGKR